MRKAHAGRARSFSVAARDATWTDPPIKPQLRATDVREDVAIADGDDAFYRVDFPLEDGHAAKLFEAIEQLARRH